MVGEVEGAGEVREAWEACGRGRVAAPGVAEKMGRRGGGRWGGVAALGRGDN